MSRTIQMADRTCDDTIANYKLTEGGKFWKQRLLGLVDVYNLLPQEMVNTDDVRTFQAKLQGMLKDQAIANVQNWENLFSPRHVLHLHPLAKMLNDVATIMGGDGCAEMNVQASIPPVQQSDNLDKPPSWWGTNK